MIFLDLNQKFLNFFLFPHPKQTRKSLLHYTARKSGKYFPKYPTKEGAGKHSRLVQWAKMVSAVFLPWGAYSDPASASINSLVDRVRSMSQSADLLERTTYGIIQDCSVGLQTDKRT